MVIGNGILLLRFAPPPRRSDAFVYTSTRAFVFADACSLAFAITRARAQMHIYRVLYAAFLHVSVRVQTAQGHSCGAQCRAQTLPPSRLPKRAGELPPAA